MNQIKKIQSELNDSIKLNSSSLVNLVENQDHLQKNLLNLSSQLKEIGNSLEQLKEPNFASYTKHNSNYKDEIYKMSFFQILKHKSLFNQESLRSSILDLDHPKESVVVNEESIIEENDLNEYLVQKDLISQIQMHLLDQELETAYEKYLILKDLIKNEMNFEIFMKQKVIQKVIIAEVLKQAQDIKVKDLEFDSLETHIDILKQEQQFSQVVQLVFNRCSQYLNQLDYKNTNIPDVVEEFFRVVQLVEIFLKEKLEEKFEEQRGQYSKWFVEEINDLMMTEQFQDESIEDRIDALQELHIYASEYDVKGLSVDFMIRKKIKELQMLENNQLFNNVLKRIQKFDQYRQKQQSIWIKINSQ